MFKEQKKQQDRGYKKQKHSTRYAQTTGKENNKTYKFSLNFGQHRLIVNEILREKKTRK